MKTDGAVLRRARKVGLRYVNDFDEGIARRRCGQGFTYISPRGKTIRDGRTRERIESLVIPPAWQEVWICPSASGHIQARGRDEAGRLQYIYHEHWHAASEANKYDRMLLFAKLLPRLRRRVRRDLNRKGLERERVLAAVVRVMDRTHIRVGNQAYTTTNGSRGATTLDASQVDVSKVEITLDFPAKSGKQRYVDFKDKKVAKIIRQCQSLDGQYLFAYRNGDGEPTNVTSSDVNEYLHDAVEADITAKDFRTWWGSTMALANLTDGPEPETEQERKREIRDAVKATAEELGNTVAVCRSSYIHPGLLASAEVGELRQLVQKSMRGNPSVDELTIAEVQLAKTLPRLEFT